MAQAQLYTRNLKYAHIHVFSFIPKEIKAYIFELAINKTNYDEMLSALEGSCFEYVALNKHLKIFLQLSSDQKRDIRREFRTVVTPVWGIG